MAQNLTDNWQMAKILTDNWHLYPPIQTLGLATHDIPHHVDLFTALISTVTLLLVN